MIVEIIPFIHCIMDEWSGIMENLKEYLFLIYINLMERMIGIYIKTMGYLSLSGIEMNCKMYALRSSC